MKGLEQIKADEAVLERVRLVAASKCPHTDTFHDRSTRVEYMPGVESGHIDRHQDTGEPILSVLVEARRCHDCGAWLSIGESNDEDERVQIEIRAAEIAQHIADVTKERSRFATMEARDVCYRHLLIDGAEIAGHMTYQFDSTKQPEQDGEWAGYLAACIAHGDEQ